MPSSPALQMLTYDRDAVYDDEWLKDTLCDTAVGAVLGGLGGIPDVGTAAGQQKSTPAKLPRMSMADFTDRNSPVWNNLQYADSAARTDVMQKTHQEMVEAGSIVTIPESEIEKVEFTVNGNVLEAKLYSTGIREVMEKLTQEKAGMLCGSSDIFRNARYMYSAPDKADDPNIYRWNYFYTPVQMGETIVGVRIAVRDVAIPAESQIYNWGIKTDASLDGAGRGQSRIPHGVSSDASR